jgi:hypothetical protein
MLEPERKAILILGMHRSGTSALARIVNLLGAAVPKDLLSPNEHNPRGYWESRQLYESHNDLLASAGSCWHDYQRLDLDRMETEAKRQGHRQRIKDAISQKFGDAPLFVLKDPRICRFVPLILSILDELNVRPVAVLPVRNPLEVASSLRERDGLTQPKSLLSWLRHVLDAEHYSRAIPRFFLRYEDLLLDWRTCLGRAAKGTGLAWPRWSSESEQAIDQFLTTNLRRQRASTEQLEVHPEVGCWIKDTYAIVSSVAENGEDRPDLDRLDLIRSKFDEACAVMGPALNEEEALVVRTGAQLASLQVVLQARTAESEALQRNLQAALEARTAESEARAAESEARAAESEALRRELQFLTGSLSWRAGKPLRVLGARFPRAATFLKRSLKS